MADYVITNGKVVTHERTFDGVVYVKDGKIERVEEGHRAPDKGYKEIKATGKFILPGAVDVHVHFRVPGGEDKEDWEHGSKAALAGGVTTVLDMPNNSPAITSQEMLERKRELVKDEAMVNYGFYVGATMDNVKEVAEMKGIAGVKVYMGSSTGDLLLDDTVMLERFMMETDHLLILHAENEECIKVHAAEHKGETDPAVHSKIRDPECAAHAVKDVVHLAKKHDRRVHITHVSTEGELDTIRKFHDGKVTIDVTPHHLFLNKQDYETYGNLIRVNPPIRDERDQAALWEGIKDGTVDMIATDHAPHQLSDKKKEYPDVPSGIPGVQTMMPLLLNAVNEERLTLEKVVELTSYNPAQKFGIKGKGEIKAGLDADMMVVDMDKRERLCHHYLWSKANWSPFHGWYFTGWPVMTFVGGRLMYEWRDKFHPGKGTEVSFAT